MNIVYQESKRFPAAYFCLLFLPLVVIFIISPKDTIQDWKFLLPLTIIPPIIIYFIFGKYLLLITDVNIMFSGGLFKKTVIPYNRISRCERYIMAMPLPLYPSGTQPWDRFHKTHLALYLTDGSIVYVGTDNYIDSFDYLTKALTAYRLNNYGV